MNRGVQALVVVTCIAVLAAVGYYFWDEWRTDAEAKAAAEAAAKLRVQQATCQRLYDLRYGGNTSEGTLNGLQWCYEIGLLDEAEVKRRLDRR